MAALPSGTVTFLFTDIEGSTALWERDRMAMAVRSGARWRPTAVTIALDNVAAFSAADNGDAGERRTSANISHPSTVPRLTAPWWARSGGSPAAASAGASSSPRRPARP